MSKRTAEEWFSELRGSRPWTEEEARRVLDAWEKSGEPVNKFARGVGLGAGRVYWWRKRLSVTTDKACTPTATFLPMVVREAPLASHGATVWTRDGHRVEVSSLDGASAVWVAMVVRSLEGGGA